MRFRKKPVEIEAEQFDGENWPVMLRGSAFCTPDWFGAGSERVIRIRTLEGDMLALKGDWIIRGVKGELYPCKPDIFEATYDPVEA